VAGTAAYGLAITPDGRVMATGNQYPQKSRIANGHVAVSDQSLYVTALDPQGQLLWANTATSPNGFCTGRQLQIEQGTEQLVLGGLYRGKHFSISNSSFFHAENTSGDNFFIARLSSTGNWLSTLHAGSHSGYSAASINSPCLSLSPGSSYATIAGVFGFRFKVWNLTLTQPGMFNE